MGFSFDAFMAGTRPNTTPMTMEKATAMMHAGTLMATGVPMICLLYTSDAADE